MSKVPLIHVQISMEVARDNMKLPHLITEGEARQVRKAILGKLRDKCEIPEGDFHLVGFGVSVTGSNFQIHATER